MPVSADLLFDWHKRPSALERLTPPWQEAKLLRKDPSLDVGSETHYLVKIAGVWVKWIERHTELEEGRFFGDIQVKGPFAEWRHWHKMNPIDAKHSILEDAVIYRTHFDLGYRYVQRKICQLFDYRHRVLKRDLEVLNRFPTAALRIGITGATGLVGSNLTYFLRTAGHTVVPISRSLEQLEGLDAVVHLAGENVGQRWTRTKRQEIERSRVEGTRRLVAKLNRLKKPPKVLVSASGIGFYGDCQEATEDTEQGEGFLAQVCQGWESQAEGFSGRVVTPRISVVLTPQGGALGRMLKPFKMGLGGITGDGKQKMSWITIHDLIYSLYQMIMDESLRGPVNCVASSCTNAEFVKTLGHVLKRPTFLPMPKAMVKLLFGEMGEELMLRSQSVKAHPALQIYDRELESALRLILGKLEVGI